MPKESLKQWPHLVLNLCLYEFSISCAFLVSDLKTYLSDEFSDEKHDRMLERNIHENFIFLIKNHG